MTLPNEPLHWHDVPLAPVIGTVLGQLDALVDGHASMHVLNDTATPSDKPFRYLLLRSGTTVKAYVNRCAHFGVPLAARQDLLIFKPHVSVSCNVHYARYRWLDGVCESGDCAGEALLPIPLDVDTLGTIRVGPDAP
jgi:nitrite reductase/ring-hydroxylating ferredoxin subunit